MKFTEEGFLRIKRAVICCEKAHGALSLYKTMREAGIPRFYLIIPLLVELKWVTKGRGVGTHGRDLYAWIKRRVTVKDLERFNEELDLRCRARSDQAKRDRWVKKEQARIEAERVRVADKRPTVVLSRIERNTEITAQHMGRIADALEALTQQWPPVRKEVVLNAMQ